MSGAATELTSAKPKSNVTNSHEHPLTRQNFAEFAADFRKRFLAVFFDFDRGGIPKTAARAVDAEKRPKRATTCCPWAPYLWASFRDFEELVSAIFLHEPPHCSRGVLRRFGFKLFPQCSVSRWPSV